MVTENLPSEYQIKLGDIEFGFHLFRYPFDVPLLHKWLNEKHAIKQWQLNKSLHELRLHFRRQVEDEHNKLFILSYNGIPFAYSEIYTSCYDRIANYYEVMPLDAGWHILIGEKGFLGKALPQRLIYIISNFIFSTTRATRIVVEPDVRVKWHVIARDYAYSAEKIVEMPEKKAMIYVCDKDRFYKSKGCLLNDSVRGA